MLNSHSTLSKRVFKPWHVLDAGSGGEHRLCWRCYFRMSRPSRILAEVWVFFLLLLDLMVQISEHFERLFEPLHSQRLVISPQAPQIGQRHHYIKRAHLAPRKRPDFQHVRLTGRRDQPQRRKFEQSEQRDLSFMRFPFHVMLDWLLIDAELLYLLECHLSRPRGAVRAIVGFEFGLGGSSAVR